MLMGLHLISLRYVKGQHQNIHAQTIIILLKILIIFALQNILKAVNPKYFDCLSEK